mmetsp:Transcript_6344/g.11012  ORF Transcript_6344/g.11012 Transcript_6344/m.11012 type:complete len:209 (+) Transcript_6344:184-810(+)|eukprot:CAMPEP_0201875658 /NCGR_PEP_ID=MMETSP0902-20130614/7569_1 /ASSEMBLY_ACC=CAM_ASM_000551 /TAXON_ID=420261 /ORGANISM="Thalassiosira antarctica, Strain CCMP982" /LENGTH=208 /DNA_ID=CAMNT_0048402753 /DNA_START=52 /DNA_END=678 /DNA_ORIENTATION=-
MKLLLLKLTASALVATSGVYALEQPSALRGSDVMVKLQGTCEDGYIAGQNDVKQFWIGTGSNCYNVWTLDDEGDKIKDEKYSSSGNWNEESYNECARNGVDAEVEKIEKACLEEDSSQCVELGNAAAEHVVMDNWCTPGDDAGTTSNTDWKELCEDMAVTICKGYIPTVTSEWCPSKTMSTSELSGLQDKCEDQVDKMVGDDFVFMEE